MNKARITAPQKLNRIVEKFGAIGCTTFLMKNKNQIVLGKNFDFIMEYGHILVNKRGIVKQSLVPKEMKVTTWVSKFGSVTFNQLGREFPYGGMNESGFIIEQSWYSGTEYPNDPDKFNLTVLQWIQYQLDNVSTIEDIKESHKHIQIDTTSTATLHFFVTDAQGNSASIEFIKGEMVVHDITECPILTNHSYAASMDFLIHNKQEKIVSNVFTGGSLERFKETRTIIQKKQKSQETLALTAFEVLENVKQEDFTQWTQVYDISNKKIYFKTLSNDQTSIVDFNALDFSPSSAVLFHNLEETTQGKVEFKEYSEEENRVLNDKVCDILGFYSELPEDTKEKTSKYPETTHVYNPTSSKL